MGFARLLHRDVKYSATDTTTGQSQTWTVVDDISPSWSSAGYSGGMGIPGAWRASILLADLVGSVPWHAYRERGDRPAERLDPTPPLLERPNPPDVRVSTFSSLALDLIWHGNAVALVAARNREGWPTAFVPVSACDVRVKRIEPMDGAPLPVGTIAYQIGNRWFDHNDVIHIKGPCQPGQLRGLGVLENHLSGALTLAQDQARQATAASGAGIPTGVLKVEDSVDEPLEREEAEDLKAAWMRSQQTRTVAVLNGRTAFEALAWNPTETQLLEARKFSLHELALIFGVPLSLLGVETSNRTYRNDETEGLNLVKFSLGGHLARFEQTLSAHMPRGSWAQANLDSLLRADTLSRYQAHSLGISAGWLTPDEVRELEDRPPLTPAQRAALAPAPQSAAPAPEDADQNDGDPSSQKGARL